MRDAITDLLSPALGGQSPDANLELCAVIGALSAMDIGLWDLSAKRKGVPRRFYSADT